ncbi:hypothetical protein ACTA71_012274 [Dictyostelium dimigraforme]
MGYVIIKYPYEAYLFRELDIKPLDSKNTGIAEILIWCIDSTKFQFTTAAVEVISDPQGIRKRKEFLDSIEQLQQSIIELENEIKSDKKKFEEAAEKSNRISIDGAFDTMKKAFKNCHIKLSPKSSKATDFRKFFRFTTFNLQIRQQL